MLRIQWARKAQKQLLRIPVAEQFRIADAVESLQAFPDCLHVRPLRNHPVGYRLRVGRYRVLFSVDDTAGVVAVEEVRKRDERTY